MYNKKPPFEITSSILDKIAEIAELVGQVNAVAGLNTNPMLRRTNRIRTIYSSLAIEQNISLTNEPFTGNDLLDVKIETADEEVVFVTNVCIVTRNGSVSQLADASVAVGGNYTDITEVLNGTDKADIYDLSGRMVKKGATTTDGLMKGVYLVNGKKVVLK